MEPREGSDPRMDPNEGESKSRSSSRSSPNLPRKSPPYTGSILPQSMPTEGFSLPSGQYDSGSSRGHSPYEYSQPSYAQAPARDPMYSSYDLPETTARRPSGGILPASTEGFSSSLAGSGGAFSSLPPLESSGYYSPSPVYGYGSSTPGYSTAAYQDPYSQSSTMGSGSPYQHSYASGMSAESGYGMYPGGVPAYPYGQPYPDQYQRGRGYGPPGGRYGGQRRPRHNTSYASVPGPPIVQPGGAKGPDGANLFVFHIPNDFSNQEMYDMFAQYGNVLSARIMVEAETGRSRGFGFVSFDSTVSAAEAIKHLNGFPIKGKRLKVQHKQIRGKENPYEPYSYYPAQQSSAPSLPIQQYAGQGESALGQEGYNLPTHLLGDEGETSADQEGKLSAQKSSESTKRAGPRQHTPVLPPMPPQPPDDEDDEDYRGSRDAPSRQEDPSPSPLGDLQDLTKALPDP